MKNLLTAITECLPDLQHYASTHGPGPDRRLANLLAALLTPAPDLLIVSSEAPAHGGCLPCRIVIHSGNDTTPYVTHLEAQQSDGRWSRAAGNYFYRDQLAEAVADYLARCQEIGVRG